MKKKYKDPLHYVGGGFRANSNITYGTDKGNEIKFEPLRILRVVPLREIRDSMYTECADLAVIFNHDIVEMDDCDEAGKTTFRWKPNQFISWLNEHGPFSTPSDAESYADGEKWALHRRTSVEHRGSLSINSLMMDLDAGVFSREEFMKYYMQMGYSLCGFYEIFDSEIKSMLRMHKGKVLKL